MTEFSNSSVSNDLAADLLTGAPQIAAFLGWSQRRVYHFVRTKQLPIKHLGGLLVARKSELSKALSAAA